jgi:hypothetical protein
MQCTLHCANPTHVRMQQSRNKAGSNSLQAMATTDASSCTPFGAAVPLMQQHKVKCVLYAKAIDMGAMPTPVMYTTWYAGGLQVIASHVAEQPTAYPSRSAVSPASITPGHARNARVQTEQFCAAAVVCCGACTCGNGTAQNTRHESNPQSSAFCKPHKTHPHLCRKRKHS